jgi:radical SAM protein with 4Fe4S-binding SPASM domain
VAAPQLVSWNLTRRCNLACGHCYLDAVQRKSETPGELATGEALDVIDQLAAAAPEAMLVLTGGEPLLRPDLDALVGAASRAGLMPVIGTNGVLLDDARAQALRAAGAAGVGISVDAADPAFHDRLRGRPGAWEAALAGVRAARRAGLAVQVQTTLFEENRAHIEALAELAAAEGALALNFFFLVCTGRGVTQTDLAEAAYNEALAAIIALQARRERPMIRARCAPYVRRLLGLRAGAARAGYEGWSGACLAGRSYLRITPQGRVTPCPYIPEVAGDLRVTPLASIWASSPTLQRLRQELPGGKCGDCDFRYSCGGCRARAAAATGDLLGEDPKCSHLRPVGVLPEPAPRNDEVARGVRWAPDAEAILQRIPSFVRERVRVRVEEKAREAGLDEVTASFVRAARPAAIPSFAAPSTWRLGG